MENVRELYNTLLKMQKAAEAEDLDKVRELNSNEFSTLYMTIFRNSCVEEGSLELNLDRARNSFLMSFQKGWDGQYLFREEELKKSEDYLSRVKNYLESAGV